MQETDIATEMPRATQSHADVILCRCSKRSMSAFRRWFTCKPRLPDFFAVLSRKSPGDGVFVSPVPHDLSERMAFTASIAILRLSDLCSAWFAAETIDGPWPRFPAPRLSLSPLLLTSLWRECELQRASNLSLKGREEDLVERRRGVLSALEERPSLPPCCIVDILIFFIVITSTFIGLGIALRSCSSLSLAGEWAFSFN